jgi:hypothetical protein
MYYLFKRTSRRIMSDIHIKGTLLVNIRVFVCKLSISEFAKIWNSYAYSLEKACLEPI